MRQMARYGFILMVICVVASGLLAAVNALTKEKIVAQARAEEEDSLREVLPGALRFEAVNSADQLLYYKGYDKQGRLVGVAFKASGKGYSSQIETMAGMSLNGVITAIKVVSHNETPGLGSRVAEPEFAALFANRNVGQLGQVQAITGATISSRAVINAVQRRAEEVRGLLNDAK
ncbi:MAG TPA: RnfABCDGE type electron transport complex subunit G [Patescibacteria group bacterium]|nr:RnfABCDGE type electron transport complex subunit G [Patescibacteria group bacterium]